VGQAFFMRPVNLTGTTVVVAARPPSLPKQQQNSDSFAAVGRHPSLSPSLLRDSRREEKRRQKKREAGTQNIAALLSPFISAATNNLFCSFVVSSSTIFAHFFFAGFFHRLNFDQVLKFSQRLFLVFFCSQSVVFRPFFLLLLVPACFLVLFLVVF
jgi:hypothetical protein